MKTTKKMLILVSLIIAWTLIVSFSPSSHGKPEFITTYEIPSQVPLQEYPSDNELLIEAYERLNREITEVHLGRIHKNIRSVSKKVDSVNAQLLDISTRMKKIEQALGIETPAAAPSEDNTKNKSTQNTVPTSGPEQ